MRLRSALEEMRTGGDGSRPSRVCVATLYITALIDLPLPAAPAVIERRAIDCMASWVAFSSILILDSHVRDLF